jgi:hypothetical protein
MPEVKSRKTVFIVHSLENSVEWDEMINVPFQPDEVIVRQVTYIHDTAEENSDHIKTNLVNDAALCVFGQSPFSSNPQSVFPIVMPVSGVFHFEARTFTGTPSLGHGVIQIMLEFVAYRHH